VSLLYLLCCFVSCGAVYCCVLGRVTGFLIHCVLTLFLVSSLFSHHSGVGPLLFNGMFSYFTSSGAPVYLPEAPFILASTLLFISFAISLWLPLVRDLPAIDEPVEEGEEGSDDLISSKPLLATV